MDHDDGGSTASTSDERNERLRGIPAVNVVVEALERDGLTDGLARPRLVRVVQETLDQHRDAIRSGRADANGLEELVARAAIEVARRTRPALAPVINATGIIIHTGLGRAPLAAAAVRAAAEAAGRYAPVELNLETGDRGRRTHLVRDKLRELTGAESATVVNNNAAALTLTLSTLAAGRSVIVSRGELVEIGGSFRLPEIMRTSGAVLREVGTTNRTRAADYEAAVDVTSGAMLKVHPSNFMIEGFAETVTIDELAALGRRLNVPVIDDIGSGAIDRRVYAGIPESEPAAVDSIAAGADLVLFSGDKLLGGPQAGIIVGRASLIDGLEAHPMMRAVRVDKIRLAALDATLDCLLDPETVEQVPVFGLLRMPLEKLRSRGRAMVDRLSAVPSLDPVELTECVAYLGGGSVPQQAVPSVAISIRPTNQSEQSLARRLRTGRPAVVPRVKAGAVLLDLRTVFPDEDDRLVGAVVAAAKSS